MANADFSQNKNSTGGFDSGSYREAHTAVQEPVLTPTQKKLAAFEKALPAPLASRTTALALCAVIIIGSAAGFGGVKLKAKYSKASQWYSQGVAADNGYNLQEELTTRANTAANVITTGTNTLGSDSSEVKAAQAALDAYTAAMDKVSKKGGMHTLYEANAALGTAIDQLYAKLQEQAENPMKMGAVQGQYGQFNSAQTVIDSLGYNQAASDYQQDTAGFPANVLKGLFGIKEVEPFA